MEVDGSVLEGGGQVLRNSLAYSHILQRPLHIVKIRAGRSKPGLADQHLKGVLLVGAMCGGKTGGAKIGAQEITLEPAGKLAGEFEGRISTAGSVSLLIQSALPCALFSPGPVTLRLYGGTNATMAPQIDFTTLLLQPTLERFGARFAVRPVLRGFFPKGGGEVHMDIEPVAGALKPVDLTERGEIAKIKGMCFVAGSIPVSVAQRMARAAQKAIKAHPELRGIPIEIEEVRFSEAEAVGAGTGIILYAETTTGLLLGGSALGEKKVSAEEVGEMAAKDLLSSVLSGSCVDEYMMDQMVIFMALADGVSRVLCSTFSLHTETAIFIAEKLAGAKFTREEVPQPGGRAPLTLVTCTGIGFKNA